MAIPNFESLMLPLLVYLGQSSSCMTQQARDELAKQFNLTPEEVVQAPPNSRTSTFVNRVAWAFAYLRQAGLISSPKRGTYAITEQGRAVLKGKPTKLNVEIVSKTSEFQASRQSPGQNEPLIESPPSDANTTLTPDEQIIIGYRRLRATLASEVLEQLKKMEPLKFENLVLKLLIKLGYGDPSDPPPQRMPGPDGGIDGYIKKDRLGLDSFYVQAKRWQANVGGPDLQQFAGALHGKHAKKGVFITTSTYTDAARKFVSTCTTPIILVDGPQLAHMMIDARVGVLELSTVHILELDEGYFSESS